MSVKTFHFIDDWMFKGLSRLTTKKLLKLCIDSLLSWKSTGNRMIPHTKSLRCFLCCCRPEMAIWSRILLLKIVFLPLHISANNNAWSLAGYWVTETEMPPFWRIFFILNKKLFQMTTFSAASDKSIKTLQWRHNGPDGVSNHRRYDCLVNCLVRRRSKKTSKLRVTGLCTGNSPATGEFPVQKTSNAENGSIWWHHYDDNISETVVVIIMF